MDFHISTAMQLTATMTLIIGLALAFTATGYPRDLQYPIQLWVRGLLLQPPTYALFSLRDQIPDSLSIIVANTLLAIAFAHLMHALRVYNGKTNRSRDFIAIAVLTAIGEMLLTYVWPSLHGRIILISVVISIYSAYGLSAIYRSPHLITRPEHLVAIMLAATIAILFARILLTPSSSSVFLTTSSVMQGVVFTFASLMPVIATSGFLLMCGERMNKDLARLATLDPLTGVYNRRTMTELANKAIAASKRHGRALSLLNIDIDRFKRINDLFGHESGDLALCRFVEIVRGMMRETDVMARLGGEEFVVILPDTEETDALNLAERIRERLDDSEFVISGWPVPLQASIGVGSLGPEINNLETLLRESDRAMYEAKRMGRNRVVAASSLRPQSSLDQES